MNMTTINPFSLFPTPLLFSEASGDGGAGEEASGNIFVDENQNPFVDENGNPFAEQ